MESKHGLTSKVSQINAGHYDFVSEVWQKIYGDNFHAGYYYRPDEPYEQATKNLITEMAKMGTFAKDSRVLDVGCGIGGPAITLHEKFGCYIHGITISPRGVEIATESAKKRGFSSHVQFSVRDAMDNQFPDASFDIIWGMESFHLMEDMDKVFSECFRVLKPGGQFLLCDNTAGQRTLSEAEVVKYYKELRVLERVFGKTHTKTLPGYEESARKAGFVDVSSRDINAETMPPSIKHFRKKAHDQFAELAKLSSEKYMQDFLKMCDTWELFYNQGVMSYGLLKARKPQ